MNSNLSHPIETLDDIAVMSGKVKTFRSLGGTVRMMIEIDPDFHDTALCWFAETDSRIAVARIKPEAIDDASK